MPIAQYIQDVKALKVGSTTSILVKVFAIRKAVTIVVVSEFTWISRLLLTSSSAKESEPRKSSKLIQLFRGYVVETWKEIDLQTCAHWEKNFIGMADAAVGGKR